MKKVAVLARYKEQNNSWEHALKNLGYDIVVFNKFSGCNLLKNVGRESHTYLHYIYNNYDNLPDEVLFSQYDPTDHHFKKQDVDVFLNSVLLDFVGFRPVQFCFDSTKFSQSFGFVSKPKYFIKYSGNKIDWPGLTQKFFGSCSKFDLIACGSSLNGLIRVSKESILKRSRDFYYLCLESLEKDVDPIEAYYFEKIWKYMFFHLGLKDLRYKEFEDKIFEYGYDKDFYFGNIKLDKDGNIRGNSSYFSHFDESYWKIQDNFLYIMQSNGGLTIKFDLRLPKLNSGNYFLDSI